jgi:hypothetical protein
VVFALDALISRGTREIFRVVPMLAINAESAEWIVFFEAKLPSSAQTLTPCTLTQGFVPEPFWRKHTVAFWTMGRPMAGMGPAVVAIAQLVLGTRNLAIRVAGWRLIASE